LYQNHRRLTAEVVRAERHWELRLFAQGVLFLWYACDERDAALAYADLIREDLEGDHWHHRLARSVSQLSRRSLV
jgi:hypothetical protein